VVAEGEERRNQWAVVRCEDKFLYSGRATYRFVIADMQGNDGRGRLWCQVYSPLMPDLAAGGSQRGETGGEAGPEGLTHLLSSRAARTAVGSEGRGAQRPSGALGMQAAPLWRLALSSGSRSQPAAAARKTQQRLSTGRAGAWEDVMPVAAYG
jgi:hypothetical protein